MKLVQMKKKSKAQAMRDMKQVGIDINVIVWQSNFPFQLAGQIHAQKVKGMNCHLAKLTTPMLCQVHKIYQPPGERNNDLTSIFQRFLSGFVPLLL